jgi:hypothetical protein
VIVSPELGWCADTPAMLASQEAATTKRERSTKRVIGSGRAFPIRSTRSRARVSQGRGAAKGGLRWRVLEGRAEVYLSPGVSATYDPIP